MNVDALSKEIGVRKWFKINMIMLCVLLIGSTIVVYKLYHHAFSTWMTIPLIVSYVAYYGSYFIYSNKFDKFLKKLAGN